MKESVELYVRVRRAEGRLYPDEVVRNLPEIPAEHPLRPEWKARASSAGRLLRYLSRFSEPLRILDLGCGNGWLAQRLARGIGARATGVDLNQIELAQACRVFGQRPGLRWVAADIRAPPFPPGSFEVVVIAASIQYFPSIPRLMDALCPLLVRGGEVHLLDSPLYADDAVAPARDRSCRYYSDLGFPEMAEHYHHHPRSAFDAYRPRWLYTPVTTAEEWRRAPEDSPFPWLRLQTPAMSE